MTIRTGKGGRYRYSACSMKARQGPTACEDMAAPMDKLDDLVASHLEDQRSVWLVFAQWLRFSRTH